jgi:hypothetical protein
MAQSVEVVVLGDSSGEDRSFPRSDLLLPLRMQDDRRVQVKITAEVWVLRVVSIHRSRGERASCHSP